jgi:hypothetical protein
MRLTQGRRGCDCHAVERWLLWPAHALPPHHHRTTSTTSTTSTTTSTTSTTTTTTNATATTATTTTTKAP